MKQHYDLDQASKLRVRELMKERTSGKYKDDKEGFAKAFKKVNASLTYDKSKPLDRHAILADLYATP